MDADPTQVKTSTGLPDWLEVALILAMSAVVLGISQLFEAKPMVGNALSLVELLLSVALIVWFHRRRGDDWSALGLARPESWVKTVGLALLLVPLVMGAASLVQDVLITPALGGEKPDISRFDDLRGNLPWLLTSLVSIWITAAFAEEFIYRGFLLDRFAGILGDGPGSWWVALVLSSVVFGMLHLYQGLAGVLITGFVGFLLGAIYLLTKRNLWIAILVHGLVDTVSLTLIYAGFAP